MGAAADLFKQILSESAVPKAPLNIAEWSEKERYIGAESGSPYPGKWDNSITPYLVEIMEKLSPDDPSRNITFKKCHQVGGTECSINLFGYTADHEPAPMLIVLPTIEEARRFSKTKLQPAIDASPALGPKHIKEQTARSSQGSTGSFKRFVGGGFAQITGANSSSGLQMLSVRVSIFEEISEWPAESGDRGDPLALAEKRSTAWSHVGYKRFYVSTPNIAGMCRVSDKYEASDQRRYAVPCPHCEDYNLLEFDYLTPTKPSAPHECQYECQSCGSMIDRDDHHWMLAHGFWISTFPEDGFELTSFIKKADIDRWRNRDLYGREPGYHINQLYSPFVSWDDTYNEWVLAEGNPEKEKVFTQQILGEAWEEEGEAPDWQKLKAYKDDYVLADPPPAAMVLTGMCDVQGNRLEWGVYGWGPGMTGHLVDKGIIQGDPGQEAVWQELDAVRTATYNGWPIEAFGVDAGYMTHMVYKFCYERMHERVFALDGRPGHNHPMIGTPRRQSVTVQGKKRGCLLWPTGTWPLKSWIYAMLRKTLEGRDEQGKMMPGAMHFAAECDDEFFKQLTAEYLAKVDRGGRIVLEWRQVKGQANEQLDIAVGALAMAHHLGLDRFSQARWEELAERHGINLNEADIPTTRTPEAAKRKYGKPSKAAENLRKSRKKTRRRKSVSSLMK